MLKLTIWYTALVKCMPGCGVCILCVWLYEFNVLIYTHNHAYVLPAFNLVYNMDKNKIYSTCNIENQCVCSVCIKREMAQLATTTITTNTKIKKNPTARTLFNSQLLLTRRNMWYIWIVFELKWKRYNDNRNGFEIGMLGNSYEQKRRLGTVNGMLYKRHDLSLTIIWLLFGKIVCQFFFGKSFRAGKPF